MKLLRIVLIGEEHPHYTITKAFDYHFDTVDTIYWERHTPQGVDALVRQKFSITSYDAVFMQLQCQYGVMKETVNFMAERSLVFNWTGDVRESLADYFAYADACVTLFTNMTDVETMRLKGYKSDYLQVGYDHIYYHETGVKYRYPEIVFCANNYAAMKFPLSEERINVARALKKEFGQHFKLYGKGWQHAGLVADGEATNREEAALYNRCAAAINLSHFNYKQYFSDRMLREMACGALVLSHNYQDHEKEFKNNEHFIVWNNLEELLYICDKALTGDQVYRSVASHGTSKVAREYTWKSRVHEFKNLIQKYK